MPNIYYGIESVFAKKNINKWINITGRPDVFSVKDENLEKMPPKFLGKYDVVSIDEALRRYPDAEIWITYANVNSARVEGKRLLNKVPPGKIHFLESDLEYRKSCNALGKALYFMKDKIPMCTRGNRKHPQIKVAGPVSEIVTQWRDFTKKLIYANQLGSPNSCLGCPALMYGFWPKSVEITNLRFLQDLAKDVCNFNCIYCDAAQAKKWMRLKDEDGPTTCDILRQFAAIPEFIDMGEKFTVTFSNGEFCANRYFDEMIDILLGTKWNVSLVSNLSLYREKLAALMQTGRVTSLITSIDAGTRETFKKIKQNDMFDRVVENLTRYPVAKTNLYVKYIFIENVNDNETDIDGYYQIVKSVGGTIQLSADKKTNATPFTRNERMRELTLRIIRKAKADGIKVTSDNNNINHQDVKFIRDNYASA